MAHKYLQANPAKPSQDEKDEELMIENLRLNLQSHTSWSGMKPAELAEAKKLLDLNDRLMEQAQDGKKQRPRNEEAILQKMLSFVKKYKSLPIIANSPHSIQTFSAGEILTKGPGISAMLGDLIAASEMDKIGLEQELSDWQKGKLDDTEMLMDAEEKIEEGKLNPEMLHEGESAKESVAMLEMDATTHADVSNAIEAVPLPVDAESEADALSPEGAKTEGGSPSDEEVGEMVDGMV